MGKLGLDMYLFFIRCEKTCDLPVTREKTVAETSFLCGFRGKGESSNPLTHAGIRIGQGMKLCPFFACAPLLSGTIYILLNSIL